MRNYSEVTAPIRGIGPENKIWHDHMDDWFRTQKKLCEAWNTNQGRVYPFTRMIKKVHRQAMHFKFCYLELHAL